MKIDFSNRNKAPRLHITVLLVTMAAGKTTTGYHYSDQMNSFMQKEKHTFQPGKQLCWFEMIFLLVSSSSSFFSSCLVKKEAQRAFLILQKTLEVHAKL